MSAASRPAADLTFPEDDPSLPPDPRRAEAIVEARRALRLLRDAHAALVRSFDAAPGLLSPNHDSSGRSGVPFTLEQHFQPNVFDDLEEDIPLWLGTLHYGRIDPEEDEGPATTEEGEDTA